MSESGVVLHTVRGRGAWLCVAAALLLGATAPAPAQADAEEALEAPLEEEASESEALAAGVPEDEALEALADEAADEDWLLEEQESVGFDPIEPGNRVIFAVNQGLYDFLLDPLADAYGFVFPRLVRDSVRRFFVNLREPSVAVNDLLRAEGRRAARAGARFTINSTVGLAGLFDPASHWGLVGHEADFGETLGVYGVGSGPYIVLPLLGPSNARDAVGSVIDAALRVDTWLLGSGTLLMIATGAGFTEYDAQRIQLEELRRSAVDFYAALRSAYHLDRTARVDAARARRDGSAELWEIPPPPRSR